MFPERSPGAFPLVAHGLPLAVGAAGDHWDIRGVRPDPGRSEGGRLSSPASSVDLSWRGGSKRSRLLPFSVQAMCCLFVLLRVFCVLAC